MITYCDVEGGWPGEGNIEGDPLFIGGDPFDYHLSGSSPCIDMGTGGDNVPDRDIDGDARPVDFPGIGFGGPGEGYDIGADELICPWNMLIDILVSAKASPRISSDNGRSAACIPAFIGAGEARGLLYSIRDRMTAEMRACAEGANPTLLHLMQRNPRFQARMLKALGMVIPYLNRPDMSIPWEIRDEITKISHIVERERKRERIDSADTKRILPEIRKIARDHDVNTVNQTLRKYGDQPPVRRDGPPSRTCSIRRLWIQLLPLTVRRACLLLRWGSPSFGLREDSVGLHDRTALIPP